jgi:hypothetical protein
MSDINGLIDEREILFDEFNSCIHEWKEKTVTVDCLTT